MTPQAVDVDSNQAMDVEENGDSMAPMRTEQGNPAFSKFMKGFWDLSSIEGPTRVGAAVEIVQHVQPPGADEAYALKRLVHGVCSSRQAARQGFASCFVEVLKELPEEQHPTADIMAQIMSATQTGGSMKGAEERDLFLGRLLGISALVRSGRLRDGGGLDEEGVPICIVALKAAIGLYSKRKWLRQAGGEVVLSIAGSMPRELLLEEALPLLLPLLGDELPMEELTPEQLRMALGLHTLIRGKKKDAGEVLEKRLLPTVLHHNHVIRAGHVKEALPALKLSAASFPKIHAVWAPLWEDIGLSPPKRGVTKGVGGEGRGSLGSRRLARLGEVWSTVVDGVLANGTLNTKGTALLLLKQVLGMVPASGVWHVLSPGVVRLILNHTQGAENYLYELCRLTLEQLPGLVADDEEVALILETLTVPPNSDLRKELGYSIGEDARTFIEKLEIEDTIGSQPLEILLPKDIGTQEFDLLKGLLALNPACRLTAEQALSEPFMSSCTEMPCDYDTLDNLPSSDDASAVDFSFDRRDATVDELKMLIREEAMLYNQQETGTAGLKHLDNDKPPAPRSVLSLEDVLGGVREHVLVEKARNKILVSKAGDAETAFGTGTSNRHGVSVRRGRLDRCISSLANLADADVSADYASSDGSDGECVALDPEDLPGTEQLFLGLVREASQRSSNRDQCGGSQMERREKDFEEHGKKVCNSAPLDGSVVQDVQVEGGEGGTRAAEGEAHEEGLEGIKQDVGHRDLRALEWEDSEDDQLAGKMPQDQCGCDQGETGTGVGVETVVCDPEKSKDPKDEVLPKTATAHNKEACGTEPCGEHLSVSEVRNHGPLTARPNVRNTTRESPSSYENHSDKVLTGNRDRIELSNGNGTSGCDDHANHVLSFQAGDARNGCGKDTKTVHREDGNGPGVCDNHTPRNPSVASDYEPEKHVLKGEDEGQEQRGGMSHISELSEEPISTQSQDGAEERGLGHSAPAADCVCNCEAVEDETRGGGAGPGILEVQTPAENAQTGTDTLGHKDRGGLVGKGLVKDDIHGGDTRGGDVEDRQPSNCVRDELFQDDPKPWYEALTETISTKRGKEGNITSERERPVRDLTKKNTGLPQVAVVPNRGEEAADLETATVSPRDENHVRGHMGDHMSTGKMMLEADKSQYHDSICGGDGDGLPPCTDPCSTRRAADVHRGGEKVPCDPVEDQAETGELSTEAGHARCREGQVVSVTYQAPTFGVIRPQKSTAKAATGCSIAKHGDSPLQYVKTARTKRPEPAEDCQTFVGAESIEDTESKRARVDGEDQGPAAVSEHGRPTLREETEIDETVYPTAIKELSWDHRDPYAKGAENIDGVVSASQTPTEPKAYRGQDLSPGRGRDHAKNKPCSGGIHEDKQTKVDTRAKKSMVVGGEGMRKGVSADTQKKLSEVANIENIGTGHGDPDGASRHKGVARVGPRETAAATKIQARERQRIATRRVVGLRRETEKSKEEKHADEAEKRYKSVQRQEDTRNVKREVQQRIQEAAAKVIQGALFRCHTQRKLRGNAESRRREEEEREEMEERCQRQEAARRETAAARIQALQRKKAAMATVQVKRDRRKQLYAAVTLIQRRERQRQATAKRLWSCHADSLTGKENDKSSAKERCRDNDGNLNSFTSSVKISTQDELDCAGGLANTSRVDSTKKKGTLHMHARTLPRSAIHPPRQRPEAVVRGKRISQPRGPDPREPLVILKQLQHGRHRDQGVLLRLTVRSAIEFHRKKTGSLHRNKMPSPILLGWRMEQRNAGSPIRAHRCGGEFSGFSRGSGLERARPVSPLRKSVKDLNAEVAERARLLRWQSARPCRARNKLMRALLDAESLPGEEEQEDNAGGDGDREMPDLRLPACDTHVGDHIHSGNFGCMVCD